MIRARTPGSVRRERRACSGQLCTRRPGQRLCTLHPRPVCCIVSFDRSAADAKSLESLEVKREPDVRPADLSTNGHLLDGRDEMDNESLSKILGGIEVNMDTEHSVGVSLWCTSVLCGGEQVRK